MQKDITSSWGTFDHGRLDSGLTAAQLSTTSRICQRGVLVKAGDSNTAAVYIGNSDVTADSERSTDGYELGAGDSVLVEVNNVNKVYVISNLPDQKVYYIAV